MNTNIIIFVAVMLYGLICLLISMRGGRTVKQKTGEGYFLGGRSYGLIIMVSSVVMGIYSGMTFYGFPPMMMNGGFLSLAASGFGFIAIAYPLIGYRLWKLSKGKNYMTMSDFLRDRYESETFGVLASIVQLVFIIPYMVVQFVSVGNGLSYSTGGFVSFEVALVIFSVFTTVYLYVGGAKGVGLMDIFNAGLAVVVPVVACMMIVQKNFGGDYGRLGQEALAIFPDMMNADAYGSTYAPINIIGLIVSGNVAMFSAPHVVSKFFMAKNRKTFQQMTVAGPALYTFLTIPMVFMGILGIVLYKNTMAANETALLVPTMMLEHTPLIIVILMLWVLFAFALSTTNGFTFAATTILSRDLVGRYGFKNVKEVEKRDSLSVRIGKYGVIVIMVLTILLSLTRPAAIVEYAYAFATPGFAQLLPALVFGLYWKRASKQAAFVGTVCGLITLGLTLFVIRYPLGIHPVMWSLGVNIVTFLITGFVTKPSDAVVEKFFRQDEEKKQARLAKKANSTAA